MTAGERGGMWSTAGWLVAWHHDHHHDDDHHRDHHDHVSSNRSYDKLSKFIYYYQQDLRVHMFEVTKDEAKEVTNLVGFV